MLFYGASVLNILNLESRKDDVGCGCATTWMRQSCQTTSGASGTSRKIFDRGAAPAPLRVRQDARKWKYSFLLARHQTLSEARLSHSR
jgi:hypothetical protein